MRIQTPNGTNEVSNAGVPFPLDEQGCITVPDDQVPVFLAMEGWSLAPTPFVQSPTAPKAAKTKE